MSSSTSVQHPARRLEGALTLPGDKSISHRALLVAGIAETLSVIEGISDARDVASSANAIQALGIPVVGADVNLTLESQGKLQRPKLSSKSRDRQVLVDARGYDRLHAPPEPIDVGNSGTTIRILLGILASSPVRAILTGDESIRRRPMLRVVDPLRGMGARIEGAGGGRFAPLTIEGGPLTGRDHLLPVASAQVKSALLLAGLRASGTTSVTEPVRSRDHTERLLRYLGCRIDEDAHRLIVKSTNIQGARVTIPGDLSSAAFALVGAAILPGSRVVCHGIGVNPTRTGILDVLEAYGAKVAIDGEHEVCGEPVATVSVEAGDRRPLEVAGDLVVRAIDELPLVAVLASTAEGESVLRDAQELRVKESDRIAAMAAGLRAMGVDIVPTPDGFVVRGAARLRGASVDSAGDHRIAMALAIAALAADGPTTIGGWDAVAVSYPGFERDLASLVVR